MIRSHPASTTGIAGALALLLGHFAVGIDDPDALAAIGAVLLSLPAAVSLLVAQGGIRGVLRKLWRGRD